jgi:hypothetical protein
VGPLMIKGGETMKNFVRRIAIVIGAAAVSAGLIGATATPVHAAPTRSGDSSVVQQVRDSQWGD